MFGWIVWPLANGMLYRDQALAAAVDRKQQKLQLLSLDLSQFTAESAGLPLLALARGALSRNSSLTCVQWAARNNRCFWRMSPISGSMRAPLYFYLLMFTWGGRVECLLTRLASCGLQVTDVIHFLGDGSGRFIWASEVLTGYRQLYLVKPGNQVPCLQFGHFVSGRRRAHLCLMPGLRLQARAITAGKFQVEDQHLVVRSRRPPHLYFPIY